jgi:predicted ATPase
VTFLVGENGSGKSTLTEAIAVAAGFNAEGGSRHFDFATTSSVSPLHEHLVLTWATRPTFGWFFRAETFFNVATEIARGEPRFRLSEYFEGHSFHDESHGESFLALALHRFHPGGFYVLDEPEAAMSFHGCLRLLAVIHDCVRGGAQFIVATHSPVLLAYPDAWIYELNDGGAHRRRYDDVESVQLWRDFLEEPDLFLRHLLADDDLDDHDDDAEPA